MTNLIIYQRLRTLLSMLFNLLLANITILLCFFFLFLVACNNFFTSSVHNENARLRLALVFPTAISITVTNNDIEMLPYNVTNNDIEMLHFTDKTIKDLSK